ncbi:ATP-grasp domain-containing protein [Aliikangiella maris]|uniref:ATP-grasp domain-containing protein n=2 Tax=Aliikangiella maris TaxID=3162458 RepID=A0ABV2BUM6_9GAMM
MSHLLIIESWVEGTGRLLPLTIIGLGHEYTFVTRNPEHYQQSEAGEKHPIVQNARQVIQCETNNLEQLIPKLTKCHQINPFDGVITICDYYVETVAAIAKSLNLPQAFSKHVALESRKHLVRQALQKAQLENPQFVIAKNWNEVLQGAHDIGFPLVIKPSDLASSAFVTLVKNEDELKVAFDKLALFTHNFREQPREAIWLLEAYIQGDEFSVEACTYNGKTTIIGITDKTVTGQPYFIEDGHMFPAKISDSLAQKIKSYVTDVLNALEHEHGITHTEVKVNGDSVKLIEINPRPAGNYIVELIKQVTGIDLLSVHIGLAINEKPDLSFINQARGSAAIKFLVPEQTGVVKSFTGLEQITRDPNIVRCQFKSIEGQEISTSIDNACYLGHVIAVDEKGNNARQFAEAALNKLNIEFE